MPRICAVCKRSPREDDIMAAVRLRPEDLPQVPELRLTEEGVYHSCDDCVQKLKPVILARLKRDGVLPATADLTAMTPHYLL